MPGASPSWSQRGGVKQVSTLSPEFSHWRRGEFWNAKICMVLKFVHILRKVQCMNISLSCCNSGLTDKGVCPANPGLWFDSLISSIQDSRLVALLPAMALSCQVFICCASNRSFILDEVFGVFQTQHCSRIKDIISVSVTCEHVACPHFLLS